MVKFDNYCYSYEEYGKKIRNLRCTAWKPNNESSFIMSGSTNDTDKIYASNLAFGLSLVRDGYIEFKYKKDSINSGVWVNGYFDFYVDYDVKIEDSENNMVWQVARYNLTKGFHNFLFAYTVYLDSSDSKTKNLSAYIDYIKVDGLAFSQTSCQECVGKSSEPGSESCIFCGYNSFLNEEKVE